MSDIIEYVSNTWYIYTVITGIFTLVCGFIAWLHKTYKKLNDCYQIVEVLSTQFQPNHGTSIKDLLDRVETTLDRIQFNTQVYWDHISIPMFIADNDGKCLWANRAYLELVGLTIYEITGSGWESIIDEIDRDDIVFEWYRACKELRPFNMKFKINRDDKQIYVKCESYGKPGIGYIGFLYCLEK